MIFCTVIRAVYAVSIAGLTRKQREPPYNAAMVSHDAARERLLHVPPVVVDTTIALALTVFIQADGAGVLGADASFQSAPAAATALLMTVPLIWRRRYPLGVFGLVLLGIIVTFTSNVTAHASLVWASVIALVIAAYSVGVHSRYSVLSVAVLAATATVIVAAFGGGLPAPPDFAVPYVLLVLPWLVGHSLRSRQLRADAFRERAIRLEQEQEFATRAALAEERARIARELHDVVAHSVSVMVVQAGAARHVLATEPGNALEALTAVETTGREAMAELRNLLGVLTPSDGEAPRTPQPGMGQLRDLVQRVHAAGLPVEMHVTGTRRALAPAVDLTAYRVVQEALTNTLKHAGSVRTKIAIDYRDDEVKVEVLDEGGVTVGRPTETPGHGLAGMRDRVVLCGGRLEAGPRLGGGYAVRAWLPIIGADQ